MNVLRFHYLYHKINLNVTFQKNNLKSLLSKKSMKELHILENTVYSNLIK